MGDPLVIINSDWVLGLKKLPESSVQCCVTSPPYWGLRDYGSPPSKWPEIDFQPMPGMQDVTVPEMECCLGREPTPEAYVAHIVHGFREVYRVLKDDGTLWLNLGDSYNNSDKWGGGHTNTGKHTVADDGTVPSFAVRSRKQNPPGLKPKDLIGIPWRVAFALQSDGWYLRSDIIWDKPNPMPESITDRPTRAHEYIFLLTKSPRYHYDHLAIKETPSPELIKQIEEGYNGKAVKDYIGASVQDASATKSRIIQNHRKRIDKQRGHGRRHAGFNEKWDALSPAEQSLCGSNKCSVWRVAPANFKEAHFATFPPKLIEPCIKAGSRPGDIVLDPFGGSGTTGLVALELGRRAVLIELNAEYIKLAQKRCAITPGLPI